MTVRQPFLSISGAGGTNLVPQWGGAFLGVTITDQAGYESDEAVIRFRAPPFISPPKNAPFTIRAGWSKNALAMTGLYRFSRLSMGGDPEDGEVVEVICRAADFIDKMKQAGSKHYDSENGFGTAGKIFKALAAEAGVPAIISPEIEQLEIPYRLRWKQSPLDFATDLADEVGAVMKPQAGRLLVMARGAGLSGSGKSLPPIHIAHDPSYGWNVELEERNAHSEIEGAWFDAKKGKFAPEKAALGAAGGLASVLHPFASKVEAKRGAASVGQQLQRYTGTGSFEGPGLPHAVAGAPVFPTGFGPADAIAWEASAVTHEIHPDDGWLTIVEVETQQKAGG